MNSSGKGLQESEPQADFHLCRTGSAFRTAITLWHPKKEGRFKVLLH